LIHVESEEFIEEKKDERGRLKKNKKSERKDKGSKKSVSVPS
jgi:hypothetical protein